MSVVIKIVLLLCRFPLLKPVLQLSRIKGHLSPRVGLRHAILIFPDIFSQRAFSLPPQSGVRVRPINQNQLLVNLREPLFLEP